MSLKKKKRDKEGDMFFLLKYLSQSWLQQYLSI